MKIRFLSSTGPGSYADKRKKVPNEFANRGGMEDEKSEM
jgi:hypothetical protein